LTEQKNWESEVEAEQGKENIKEMKEEKTNCQQKKVDYML